MDVLVKESHDTYAFPNPNEFWDSVSVRAPDGTTLYRVWFDPFEVKHVDPLISVTDLLAYEIELVADVVELPDGTVILDDGQKYHVRDEVTLRAVEVLSQDRKHTVRSAMDEMLSAKMPSYQSAWAFSALVALGLARIKCPW